MTKQAEIQQNTTKLIEFISRKFETGELDNTSLVEVFKASGRYLNLQTISDYAREHKMSYEGVKKFRKIAKIKTCSMHGRPFKKHDNRDLWRVNKNHDYLINELKMVGEVYLDIDYSDIAYINDTGRNWTSQESNIRDKVSSKIPADFRSSAELISYFKKTPHKKIVFQIHPERWSDNFIIWHVQNLKDGIINLIKKLILLRRRQYLKKINS